MIISIHAPRMGSDRIRVIYPSRYPRISIHAPRMGSDSALLRVGLHCRYFNPRSPDGERPAAKSAKAEDNSFQSTLPGWGATHRFVRIVCDRGISIHAPRMGSDFPNRPHRRMFHVFQSTLPGWGATPIYDENHRTELFQSTLPGWGATRRQQRRRACHSISIHAPRMGSDGSSH